MITKAPSKPETLTEFADRYFESQLAGDLQEFDRYKTDRAAMGSDPLQLLINQAETQTVGEIRDAIRKLERIAERKS